jgi:hypothetical protein
LAKSHKLLEVQYGNRKGSGSEATVAKIATADDLLRLIFLRVGANLPLRQTCVLVAKSGGPDVEPVVLHKKMQKAGPFLQALVHRMSAEALAAPNPDLCAGYDLVAIDATTDSSPGSDGTDARLHTMIRVSDLSVIHVEVTDGRGGETLKRFPLQRGQLALIDRGYSNAPGIASAVDKGADVLVRVNRGSLPVYERDGHAVGNEAIPILGRLRSLAGYQVQEWPVGLRTETNGEQRLIGGRLIAVRLPDRKAEEARERVRREYGKDASADMLEAAGYVALFTTVPASRMSAARCIETYRVRWQIELLFKRWKSICGLDKLPNFREDSVRSWILAKICLALILDRMGSAPAGLFPPEREDTVLWRCAHRWRYNREHQHE